jgi:hypothetical protein
MRKVPYFEGLGETPKLSTEGLVCDTTRVSSDARMQISRRQRTSGSPRDRRSSAKRVSGKTPSTFQETTVNFIEIVSAASSRSIDPDASQQAPKLLVAEQKQSNLPRSCRLLAAVVNGVAAVPIMIITMRIADYSIIGKFTPSPTLTTLGWIATGVMIVASVAMMLLF